MFLQEQHFQGFSDSFAFNRGGLRGQLDVALAANASVTRLVSTAPLVT